MTNDRTAQLADLAHFVLSVARDIRLNGHADPEIIEVSELESLVMDYVEHEPGVSPSQICAEVGIRSSNTSAVLRTLEAKGMIRRDPDPDDRRAVMVHPTALAAANLERVRAEWSQFLARHFDDTADIQAAIDVLRTIDRSVRLTAGSTPAQSSR